MEKPPVFAMVKTIKIACIMLVVWVFSFPASAQFYNGSQITFGKNRVQYTDFLWTYFRFNNYDVYYKSLNLDNLKLETLPIEPIIPDLFF